MNATEHEEWHNTLRENGHWWVTEGHEGFKPETRVNMRLVRREEGRMKEEGMAYKYGISNTAVIRRTKSTVQ